MKNKREFIREKRRQIKVARKACKALQYGCMVDFLDETFAFAGAVRAMGEALDVMDAITKEAR